MSPSGHIDLEHTHGAWLDQRAANGKLIALGAEVALYGTRDLEPLGAVSDIVLPLARVPGADPPLMIVRGWVRSAATVHTGCVVRSELLSALRKRTP